MSSLIESVQRVEEASQRLRLITFGFLALLGVLAALVGALGWDILPRFLKAGISTLM